MYSSNDMLTASGIGAVFGYLAGAATVALLIVYVLLVAARWKIFDKMGEAAWKSIIPFYSDYVQGVHTWTGGMQLLTAVLLCAYAVLGSSNAQSGSAQTIIASVIGIAGFVMSVIGNVKLAKAFNRGIGFIIGLIFLNSLFMLILGFGKSRYVGNTGNKDARS